MTAPALPRPPGGLGYTAVLRRARSQRYGKPLMRDPSSATRGAQRLGGLGRSALAVRVSSEQCGLGSECRSVSAGRLPGVSAAPGVPPEMTKLSTSQRSGSDFSCPAAVRGFAYSVDSPEPGPKRPLNYAAGPGPAKAIGVRRVDPRAAPRSADGPSVPRAPRRDHTAPGEALVRTDASADS